MSAAMIAAIGSAPVYPKVLGFLLALLAGTHPAGITLGGDMGQASIIIRELPVEMVDGVPEMGRDALLDGDVFSSGHDLVCPFRTITRIGPGQVTLSRFPKSWSRDYSFAS
jgi:hypothetical protein